jgi:ectoine hydroxylase
MRQYEDEGFVFLTDHFSPSDMELVRAELPAIFASDTPMRVVEESGVVRSVYGSHTTNELLGRLSRHPKIVGPAEQIVGDAVYIYQFKINAKVAFSGDVWEWHQDYVFWLKEDGMPAPRVTNAMIFLDEVNEFNAPLTLIPGSHKEGVIDVGANAEAMARGEAEREWLPNLTAKLKYTLGKETVGELVSKYSLAAPKGRAGSVLFFDSNLVHGSANNISPFDRALVLVTFNSVRNAPLLNDKSRPDFLVSRDNRPLAALAEGAPLASGNGRPGANHHE